MEGLMLHTRGSRLAEVEELEAIPIPPETDSYKPVSHFVLANTLATIGQDLLKGCELVKQQYGLPQVASRHVISDG